MVPRSVVDEDELRFRTVCFGTNETVSGQDEDLRHPHVSIEFKSKLGYLLVYFTPDNSDMEGFQEKLSPEAYKDFSQRLHDELSGMAQLITGASKITCQVTGRLGAARFVDDRGVILTLHPDTVKELKLKPWKEQK